MKYYFIAVEYCNAADDVLIEDEDKSTQWSIVWPEQYKDWESRVEKAPIFFSYREACDYISTLDAHGFRLYVAEDEA